MPRPTARPTPHEPVDAEADGAAEGPGLPAGPVVPTPAAVAALGSLSDLPVAGLTRRRIALLLGAIVAAWVIVLFARQVGEASDASSRAAEMRVANAQLEADVRALEREVELIQRQAYIEQQAREYRLGDAREIPFVLAPDAAPLAADAPGTAASRLGADVERATPLESWLNLMFGAPGDPARPPAGGTEPGASPGA
jgi:cell division protein FtsB